jgi:hypothetical protein
MRMNMLPEKLRLCRSDGFEAGPVVNRVANVARPDYSALLLAKLDYHLYLDRNVENQ